MNMKLSVVLALHNEADVISDCLKSVYDIADEIVVVDGQSTDKTIEKIKVLDVDKKTRIITVPNEKNFHLMKQVAIGAANGEWTFQIDADERLSLALKDEIKTIINKKYIVGDKLGYWVKRLNYFLGRPLRKGGQYPDKTLRFYRSGHGYLPAKDVHEQALITKEKMVLNKDGKFIADKEVLVDEASGLVATMENDLLHYPYRSFAMYLDKWKRYNKLEAGRMKSKPSIIGYLIIKPCWWFLKTYFRHLGYVDGFSGFVFSLFSAIRYWGIWWEYKNK